MQIWCIVSSLTSWQEETELSFCYLSLSTIVLSISNYSWITFFIHISWLQRISKILQTIFLSQQLLFILGIHQWNFIRNFPDSELIWHFLLRGRRTYQFLGVPKSFFNFLKIQSLTWFNNEQTFYQLKTFLSVKWDALLIKGLVFTFLNFFLEPGLIMINKRRVSCDHVIEKDSKSPIVDRFCVLTSLSSLRSTVHVKTSNSPHGDSLWLRFILLFLLFL